jgi:hypothetical protein
MVIVIAIVVALFVLAVIIGLAVGGTSRSLRRRGLDEQPHAPTNRTVPR